MVVLPREFWTENMGPCMALVQGGPPFACFDMTRRPLDGTGSGCTTPGDHPRVPQLPYIHPLLPSTMPLHLYASPFMILL